MAEPAPISATPCPWPDFGPRKALVPDRVQTMVTAPVAQGCTHSTVVPGLPKEAGQTPKRLTVWASPFRRHAMASKVWARDRGPISPGGF